MRQLPLSVRLVAGARFDNYLAGANESVVAQLRELASPQRAFRDARAPGVAGARGVAGGLTWLCGPPGAGKTHLLQALGADASTGAGAGTGAVYLPLSQLTAMGPAALAAWQGADLLCIDELGTVIGHRAWESALFGLYRDCEERGASLVCAAREAPMQLRFALPDLASRCAAGQRLTLQALDESQQRSALQLRAQQRGFELPEETAHYLLRRLPRDMSSLCAVLDTLDNASLEAQRRLTVPFIREVLQRQAPGVARRCRITGRVHGVHYRASAARRAAALGVSGYARNDPDGSVEVLASGSPAAVREFIGWLWVGPPAAIVTLVDEGAAETPPPGAPREFTVA